MSLVIKKHSHTRASTARIFRGMAKLSDGKYAVLTYNSNITAKKGSSSEKNNTPKLYVVIFNADWSTFLTASITIGDDASKHRLGVIASMAVDSSNDIHVVYNYRADPQVTALKSQGQSLRYRKVTYNGATLSVGSETVIFSTTGYYSGVDIDVPIGASVPNPVVAFVHTTDGKVFTTRVSQLTGLQTTQIESVTSAGRGVSLALNNASDAASYRWLVATYQLEAGTDVGDTIFWGTGTTSSAPVLQAILAQNLNVGLGGGMRHLAAFRDGNSLLVTGPVLANPYTHFLAAYHIPTEGSVTVKLAPTNVNIGNKFVANAGYAFAAIQLISDYTAIVCHMTDGKNIFAQIFDYVATDSSVTITRAATQWRMDQQYLSKNQAPALIYNGDRSRNGTVDIGAIVDIPEAFSYILYTRVPTGGKIPALLSAPANGGSVNKSNATISVAVTGNTNNNVVGRVQLQTARDATFQTEVNNFYSGYQTLIKSMTIPVNLTAGTLGQGKYFVRMRIVDFLGYAYQWDSTQTFYVTHKPTALILTPAQNATAVYNADNTVTFKIGFTDSDLADYQTAYRIQVTNPTGTAIADTGKVVSTATTVNVAIPSVDNDTDMTVNAWVWDSDNVSSDAASNDFHLASQPEVYFDYPDGTVVETAMPTYSWVMDAPESRTQAQYRITVRRGSTLIYDSTIKNGDADALIQPRGYIKNNSTYSVTVWIKDSLGMVATATETFSTAWQKPVPCPAPYVDLTLYNELGFAYVTMIPPAIDPDIIPMTELVLMRRSIFSNEDWEEVNSLQMGVGLNYSLLDSTLPSGVDTYYAAVLRIDNGGDIAEGDPDDSYSKKVTTQVGDYWIVSKDNPERNTIIPVVTGDSFTDEKEQEVLVIANRGRWVDTGEILGANGTLTAKVYDKEVGLGGIPVVNYIQNPRLLANGTGTSGIVNWVLQNANYITRRTYSPCPIGKEDSIAIGKTGASNAIIYQVVKRDPGNHTLSVWVENSLIAAAAGKSFSITATCRNSANETLATFTQNYNLTQSGSAMVPPGAVVYASQIGSQFNWYRLNKSFTAPANTANIVVTITLVGVVGDYLTIGGATLIDSLNSAVKFFDGYTNGAEWMREDALNSSSFSAGKVTARIARRRLQELANSDVALYLRNPFGDVFKVSAGQIQVDRVAGTGANEYVNLSIPYLELK